MSVKKMITMYLYTRYERFWHWLQALLIAFSAYLSICVCPLRDVHFSPTRRSSAPRTGRPSRPPPGTGLIRAKGHGWGQAVAIPPTGGHELAADRPGMMRIKDLKEGSTYAPLARGDPRRHS